MKPIRKEDHEKEVLRARVKELEAKVASLEADLEAERGHEDEQGQTWFGRRRPER